MGTYHSAQSKVSEAGSRGTSKTREEIFAAFDYALAHPLTLLTTVGPKFGMGGSSMANWLYCPPKVTPNKHVIAWLKSHDSLDGSGPTKIQLWEKRRPSNSINVRIRDAVYGTVAQSLADALPKVIASARQTREFEGVMPNLVDKVTLDPFVPQTPDDLLVLIEQATTIKAEAEATAQEAAELIAAVSMVRDWVNNSNKLDAALKEVAHLKAQLVAADKAKADYQKRALASNQVHSTD
jgi:hypothetical protein